MSQKYSILAVNDEPFNHLNSICFEVVLLDILIPDRDGDIINGIKP